MNQLLKALYAMSATPLEPVKAESNIDERTHEDRRGMDAAGYARHGRRATDLPDQAQLNCQDNNRKHH
jgi:hypothetical protein